MAMQRLKLCREAKIELSSSTSTEINLPYIIASRRCAQALVVKTLTRCQVETLAHNSSRKHLEPPVKKAGKRAGLNNARNIDEVIMWWFFTYSAVQRLVEFFSEVPSRCRSRMVVCNRLLPIREVPFDGRNQKALYCWMLLRSMGIETMGGVMIC